MALHRFARREASAVEEPLGGEGRGGYAGRDAPDAHLPLRLPPRPVARDRPRLPERDVTLIAGAALCIGLAGCATLPSDSGNADTGPPPRCDPSVPWMYAAAGKEIFCGVHADGCAECWGDQPVADTGWDTGGGFFDRGQFEVPDLALSTVSVMAAHVGASQNDTVCGTTTDGGALCWGRKSAQLPRSYRYTRVDPGGACAARVGGGVDCDPDWGTPPDSVDVAVAMNVVVVLRSDGELWMREDDYGFTVVDLGTPPYSAVDVMTPYHGDTAVFVSVPFMAATAAWTVGIRPMTLAERAKSSTPSPPAPTPPSVSRPTTTPARWTRPATPPVGAMARWASRWSR